MIWLHTTCRRPHELGEADSRITALFSSVESLPRGVFARKYSIFMLNAEYGLEKMKFRKRFSSFLLVVRSEITILVLRLDSCC